jgi:hypothetical protein
VSIDIVQTISDYVKVPDETVSENEHDRFHHLDLHDCSELDLRREISFTRWLNFITDSEWHQEREEQVAAEIRRRHGRGAE